jgi:hypothetical protein
MQTPAAAQMELSSKFYSDQLGIAAAWIRYGAAGVCIGSLTFAVILVTIVNFQSYKRAELQRQRSV